MPTGISQSSVNPAALVPRTGPPQGSQRETEPAAAADTENAQAALATNNQNVVRAPEQPSGGQRADNSTSTGTGQSEQATSTGVQPPPQGLQAEVDRGLGGNVDITA